MEDINRIKVVLVEKKRTNKWLAEQLFPNGVQIHHSQTSATSLRLQTCWELT